MSDIHGPLIDAATLLCVLVLQPFARNIEHIAILTFTEQFHKDFRKAEMRKMQYESSLDTPSHSLD